MKSIAGLDKKPVARGDDYNLGTAIHKVSWS